MGMDLLAIIALIVVFAFLLFLIYFIFKNIQFILVSVGLYKKMVNNQETMVKILVEIRDQGKHPTPVKHPHSITDKNTNNNLKPNQKKHETNHNLKESNGEIETNGLLPLAQTTIHACKNELAKFGYKLSGSKNKWIIKAPDDALTTYTSVDKLKMEVEKITKENSMKI